MKQKALLLTVLLSMSMVTVNSQTKRNISNTKGKSNSTATVNTQKISSYNGVVGDYLPFTVKFQPMQSTLGPAANPVLKNVSNFLKLHKDINIVVVGYSSKGKDISLCKKVAEKRALAVKNALIRNYGISADRIIASSKGIDDGEINLFSGSSDAVVFHEQYFILSSRATQERKKEIDDFTKKVGSHILSTLFDSGLGMTECHHCNGTGWIGDSTCPYCHGNATEFSDKKLSEDLDQKWRENGMDEAVRKVTNASKSKSAVSSNNKNGYQIKEYENGIYEGYLTNGKRNGLGMFFFQNGDSYTGQWKDDKMTGRGMKRTITNSWSKNAVYDRLVGTFADGVITGDRALLQSSGEAYIGGVDENGKYAGFGKKWYRNGAHYEGNWRNGRYEGNGTLTDNNGDKLTGNFHLGEINGNGTLLKKNGDYIEGRYLNGSLIRGKYVWANGNIYEGDFEKDVISGKGVMTFANGTRYEGNFKNGTMQGKGVMTWKNGDKYEGEFSKGERTGKGVLYYTTNRDKNSYEGDFVKGEKQGWGIEKYPSGDFFVGKFENGWKTEGTMYWVASHVYQKDKWIDKKLVRGERGTWTDEELKPGRKTKKYPNGDTYTGWLKYNIPEGGGTYTWANGDKYTGDWKHGERQGKGTFTWANGDFYNGVFNKDEMTGKGTKTYANGEKYTGEFWKGQMHGKGIYSWPNGDSFSGEYFFDKRLGKGIMRYSNKKYEYGMWRNNKLEMTLDEGKWKEKNGKYEYRSNSEKGPSLLQKVANFLRE